MRRKIARIVALVVACLAGCMAVATFLIDYFFCQAIPPDQPHSFFVASIVWFPVSLAGLIAFLWLSPGPVSPTARCYRLGLLVLVAAAGILGIRQGLDAYETYTRSVERSHDSDMQARRHRTEAVSDPFLRIAQIQHMEQIRKVEQQERLGTSRGMWRVWPVIPGGDSVVLPPGARLQYNERGAPVGLSFEDAPEANDMVLESVKRVTSLQRVDLARTRITDAGLEHLGRLFNLRELDLTGTQVTDAGVEKLHKALPKCQILH